MIAGSGLTSAGQLVGTNLSVSARDSFENGDGIYTGICKDPKAGSKENGFAKISLFEKAEAKQDENGLWQVDLVCTESALEYIFNIENIGYLRYRLKNIIDLTKTSKMNLRTANCLFFILYNFCYIPFFHGTHGQEMGNQKIKQYRQY